MKIDKVIKDTYFTDDLKCPFCNYRQHIGATTYFANHQEVYNKCYNCKNEWKDIFKVNSQHSHDLLDIVEV